MHKKALTLFFISLSTLFFQTSVQAQDLSGLSADDQSSIETACINEKVLDGPAAYHACQNRKLVLLGSNKAPSLSGLSADDQSSIEMACINDKVLNGPAAYHVCLNRQLDQFAAYVTDHPTAVSSSPAASGVISVKASATPTIVNPLCAENGSCYGDISVKAGLPKTTAVHGYTKADGTYVRGYYRSR